MGKPTQEQIIAKLEVRLPEECPICGWDRMDRSTADDGIPDGQTLEHYYGCGARLAVDDGGNFYVNAACPQSLQDKADELTAEVIEELEEEFGS